MAKDAKIPLNLTPFDELFTTQEARDDQKREKVMDIELSEIDPFVFVNRKWVHCRWSKNGPLIVLTIVLFP